jgi:hypothetical protein
LTAPLALAGGVRSDHCESARRFAAVTAPANVEERLLAIALAAERVLGTAADRLGTPPLLAS